MDEISHKDFLERTCTPDADVIIWRYMDISRFVNLLVEGALHCYARERFARARSF